jgi:hypothetical protein
LSFLVSNQAVSLLYYSLFYFVKVMCPKKCKVNVFPKRDQMKVKMTVFLSRASAIEASSCPQEFLSVWCILYYKQGRTSVYWNQRDALLFNLFRTSWAPPAPPPPPASRPLPLPLTLAQPHAPLPLLQKMTQVFQINMFVPVTSVTCI